MDISLFHLNAFLIVSQKMHNDLLSKFFYYLLTTQLGPPLIFLETKNWKQPNFKKKSIVT